MVVVSLGDKGISVRKKAIKILSAVCAQNPTHAKVALILASFIERMPQEDEPLQVRSALLLVLC